MIIGTLVNVATVLAGSAVGLMLKSKLPDSLLAITFQAIGLVTVFFGISMSLRSENWLLIILSVVTGGIIGQMINLESRMNRLGERIKQKLNISSSKFSEGIVTSFLLFCMGSMTILGAVEEGMKNNSELLLAKSVMDGFSSIALAAAMGIGVMFSSIPLLIYQGLLTLFAGNIQHLLTEPLINEITAAGGIMLIGMGFNILDIKRIAVVNLLPSLVTVILLFYIFRLF